MNTEWTKFWESSRVGLWGAIEFHEDRFHLWHEAGLGRRVSVGGEPYTTGQALSR